MTTRVSVERFFPDRNIKDIDRASFYLETALHYLGIPIDHFDDLRETPGRAIRAWDEMWTYPEWNFTVFDTPLTDEGDYSDLGIVLQSKIPFRCLCRHHLLPFVGTAHIAYVPGKKFVGISKLSRLLHTVTSYPGVQEEIGLKVVEFLMKELEPVGAAVILSAEHSCSSLRGPRIHSTNTITSILRGCFKTELDARAELFALLQLGD